MNINLLSSIRVSNMKSPTTNKEVPNQFMIETPTGDYFQSYSTVIAYRNKEDLYLDKDSWNCTITTAKYRNNFTGLDTKETKKAIKDGSIILTNLNKELQNDTKEN